MAQTTTSGQVGDFARGAWMPLRGVGLLASDPLLMVLAILPMLLTLLATGLAGWAMLTWGDALLGWMWDRPAACSDCGAVAWVWSRLEVGGWWTAWAVQGLVIAAAAGLVASRVLPAPVMDFLAQRAMGHLGARPADGVQAFGDLPLAIGIGRSIGRAAGRGVVLLAGYALLFALSLVPGGAVVAAPLGLVWTAFWLYVDTVGYALQWIGEADLADVKRLVRDRPALALGFAVSSSAMLLVPLAGLVVTPATVAGACLYVAEWQRDGVPARPHPPLPRAPSHG